jgi:hypothetical protein
MLKAVEVLSAARSNEVFSYSPLRQYGINADVSETLSQTHTYEYLAVYIYRTYMGLNLYIIYITDCI